MCKSVVDWLVHTKALKIMKVIYLIHIKIVPAVAVIQSVGFSLVVLVVTF